MAEASRPDRSYEGIARSDREDLFARKPGYLALDGLLICVALRQGAALHFLDGHNGAKGFDI